MLHALLVISSLNFKVITLDYWSSLIGNIAWIYFKNFFVHTLDTLWHTHEISKELNKPKCVKKFSKNWIYNSRFRL